MKLKKIFAAFIAAVTIAGTTAATCFAVGDGEAAYCFDTAAKTSDWQTYGSVDETGFKFTQTTKESKNGEGSLLISEDNSEEVTDAYGGAFITADTLGLSNFGGCTISMSVLLTKSAENRVNNFGLYSDGVIWLFASSGEVNSETWTDIVLEIPADAGNTRVGFTIPTFDVYKGDVLFIDDFSVVDADGRTISNQGDYKMKTIRAENTVAGWVNIVLIVVLVILIVVIVVGIGILVSSGIRKFH